MEQQFYSLYNTYSQKELFDVLLHAADYQPEAIATAQQVLKEKGWIDHYQKILAEQKVEREKEAKEEEKENIEKAEYYRKAVQFKMLNNTVELRLSQVPAFEARLAELNIDYFVEDRNAGVLRNGYPVQTYYFKNEDAAKADKICMELGISASTYLDPKPFFFAELKMTVGALAFLLFVYLLYYLATR